MASLMATGSLIAPIDALRFTVAYLALILAPGYGVATLARPGASRTERLALALPCAYTLVTICGLAAALLHRPFDILVYAMVAVPVTLAGGCMMRFRPAVQTARRGFWHLVPAVVASVQLGAIAFVYKSYSVPSSNDALAHVVYIARILHTHHFPLALLSSSNAYDAQGGFYPPVFHVATSLVLSLVPMPPYEAAFFSVIACVAVLPLGLFACVEAVMGSARLAGLAALCTLAFEPLPMTVLAKGLYPFIAAEMFVPAFTLAVIAAVTRKDRRALALAALLGVGLFYTHPTELLTAVLLAMTAALPLLRDTHSWGRAVVCAVACAVTWSLAALPVLHGVHHTMVAGAQVEVQARGMFRPSAHARPGAALGQYLSLTFTRDFGLALLALVIVGGAWSLTRRRHVLFVVMHVVLLMVFVDESTYNALARLYVLSFPWATPERLSPTHYWFSLPLAAIGADVTVRVARRRWHDKKCTFLALITAPVVLLGLVLPLDTAAADTNFWAARNNVVLPADLGALSWLAHHAPADTVIVNDAMIPAPSADPPVDAGIWIQALVSAQPLFTRAATGPGSLADRLDLLAHVAEVPLPDRVARFISRYRVRYVFYGSTVRIFGRRHLNLRRLLADPLLHLIYSSASTCQDNNSRGPMTCPSSASYVFALRAPKPSD
jgi:hypothetical protein